MTTASKVLRAAITSIPLGDRRGEQRWRLQFATGGTAAAGTDSVEVHDLSEAGLRIVTSLELSRGETIAIDLPAAGRVEARVVWKQGQSCGCEFVEPLERSMVGRIILQTPSPAMDEDDAEREEIVIGVQPSMDHIAAWKADFENTRGRQGYRLTGFRQLPGGLTMAIVEKA
ncbi:hypothetical protein B2G71_09555 [Novosphingobium sp. PC22D]|uniref:PilZ domain-containing protein n=1 Tax=Novosphingobium sp. PC22D TaxID=1962403 RepID=UPI000BFAD037|nr:PilZ domain-containing protein [Novosphingobium sp. PC22D]PEQ13057.1 hypothetical protein B2G71_09555 [Novosphingobium sp. PC22D]